MEDNKQKQQQINIELSEEVVKCIEQRLAEERQTFVEALEDERIIPEASEEVD